MRRDITDEMKAKMAGLLPVTTSFTIKFTPKDYEAIDEEFRPIFTLKPWNANQMKEIAQAGNNEAKAIKLIVSQIVGFQNLINLETGEEIEFSTDLKFEELLPKKVLLSILSEISRISGL